MIRESKIKFFRNNITNCNYSHCNKNINKLNYNILTTRDTKFTQGTLKIIVLKYNIL